MSDSLVCPQCSLPLLPDAQACPACALEKPPSVTLVPPPSFFLACAPRWLQSDMLQTYRLYVVGQELLAFPAGLGSIVNGQFVQMTSPRIDSAMGNFGRMFKALSMESQHRGIREYERACELEHLDDVLLRREATRRRDTIILARDDLRQVRIKSLPGWYPWLRGFTCPALLVIQVEKSRTLALPSLKDARKAAADLHKLLGETLIIDLPWLLKSENLFQG
jgi:hypothetical protein